MSHCTNFSESCKYSAQMLCDHESLMSMQYMLDQTRRFMNTMTKPQYQRNETFNGLEFDNRSPYTCHQKVPSSIPMHLDEFYMKPCSLATFKNNLVCNKEECCSYNHQMFMNHTRAGTGKL